MHDAVCREITDPRQWTRKVNEQSIVGGGALAGKHPTHIDRIDACAARQAAVQAVRTGARECRVTVAWAPNEPAPLEVVFEMEGRGERKPAEFFDHEAMRGGAHSAPPAAI